MSADEQAASPEKVAVDTPAAVAMLPDGSNPEGIDPSPPLNWDKDSFKKGTKVKLYGMTGSPPCAKIITYLKYFKVDYELTGSSGKPGTDYKKMPVLDVGERQVNDSYIITKNLIPALVGPEAFDEEWEMKISYTLHPTIEMEVVDDGASVRAWATHSFGMGCCMGSCLAGCVIAPMVRSGLQKNELMKVVKHEQLVEIGKELRAKVGTQTYAGGAEPCQVDLSFYGTMASFIASGCPTSVSFLKECDLDNWFAAMDAKVPLKEVVPQSLYTPPVPAG